jgi:hypothetical protein
MALPYTVVGKAINAGADALDYKLPTWAKTALDPVGAAKNYVASKAESAMGLPSGSIGLATDPSGFARNLAKDVSKDYIKNSFVEREPIPVEDLEPSPVGNLPEIGNIEDIEWEGEYKRGGKVKAKAPAKTSKPKISTASRRGDGIAQRGKTRGRMV